MKMLLTMVLSSVLIGIAFASDPTEPSPVCYTVCSIVGNQQVCNTYCS